MYKELKENMATTFQEIESISKDRDFRIEKWNNFWTFEMENSIKEFNSTLDWEKEPEILKTDQWRLCNLKKKKDEWRKMNKMGTIRRKEKGAEKHCSILTESSQTWWNHY
jgi:hypothetical protein